MKFDSIWKTCPKTGRKRGFDFSSKWMRWLFPVFGLAALVWLLLRVAPRPSRLRYPCVQIAAPIAAGFLLWLGSVAASALAFTRARRAYPSRKLVAAGLVVAAVAAMVFTVTPSTMDVQATLATFNDPLGPNQPIGDAQGINPGRVVWVHEPDATNETCQPTVWNDAYFMDKNTNQAVVNRMLDDAIRQLTDETDLPAAWEALFRYFNQQRDKGDVGYANDETIFIKVNAVHAGKWNMNSDGSIKKTDDYGLVDTSPQVMLALVRHLVRHAGVPEENIYIGDPLRSMFKHTFDKIWAEFPGVVCVSSERQSGLQRVEKNTYRAILYSDGGDVMDDAVRESLISQLLTADYLINIPALKGHRWGGVTFFAKNHFGSHTRSGASHLHDGLMRISYNDPLRTGYRHYRVFVDLIASSKLGGKTLLYLMDGLWGTSYEHDPPVKFRSAPFNNDWSSSIFVSQDPVAIESVCLDVLQAEFTEEETDIDPPRYTYVQWDGVDDYLHQAASSEWWPEGIEYDPDNTGEPIPSQGVHEHWNNAVDKQYSRNLGTGDGIELVLQAGATGVEHPETAPELFTLHANYPNPFNPVTQIRYDLPQSAKVTLTIYNANGRVVAELVNAVQPTGAHAALWNAASHPSGVYVARLAVNNGSLAQTATQRMMLLK